MILIMATLQLMWLTVLLTIVNLARAVPFMGSLPETVLSAIAAHNTVEFHLIQMHITADF